MSYRGHSRQSLVDVEIESTNCFTLDMSSVLCAVLLKLCAAAVRLTDRFAMEHAMLVAILHSNVGQEVGECGQYLTGNGWVRFEALQYNFLHVHVHVSCTFTEV